jgi:hypothetical protein
MNKQALIRLSVILYFITSYSVAWNQTKIEIHIPTAREETDYIWYNLQDIAFFEANNYDLALPKGALLDSLINKSRSNQLTSTDYQRLESFMKSEVYQASDYNKAFEKINEQIPLLDSMIFQLSNIEQEWHFNIVDTYRVQLTLYGPGGSYDPDNGTMTIFTTQEGAFKQYTNPANTLIHEIVHIGIEESIIQKHRVPHTLKERIVDTFVLLYFGALLPEYRLQQMGEERLDAYVRTKSDLKRLDKIVADILK